MNYAIVDNGTVTNLVVWDGETEWAPPAGSELVPAGDTGVGVGWLWDGSTFTQQETIEPDFTPIVLEEPPA